MHQCMATMTMKEPTNSLSLDLLLHSPNVFIRTLYEIPISDTLQLWKFIGPLVADSSMAVIEGFLCLFAYQFEIYSSF